MIVNTQWLMQYLDPPCSHEQLVEVFPRIGLEIEDSHALGQELETVRIGFIREKTALEPKDGGDDGSDTETSEQMWLCQIEIDPGVILPIVCASVHEVQVGWGVPVAPVGANLPTGVSVKEGRFCGVVSQGMICMDGEMGLMARGSGLSIFKDESLLGKSLPSVMSIEEYLVDVAVLPNRPDCLGLIGIAREVAAHLKLSLRYPEVSIPDPESPEPESQEAASVEIRSPDRCPRYLCQLIKGVRVGPSPAWLKAFLLSIGNRPINNIVDITNFVLYEWGQPLHAFDFSKLAGGKIIVRLMEADEKLQLLNGTELKCEHKDTLVIADEKRPIALAGIMGGIDTETSADTVDLLLEAACFEPVGIRTSLRKINIGNDSGTTDSAYRFERGTDPNFMLKGAAQRATALILELAGGAMAGPLQDDYPQEIGRKSFQLDAKRVSRLLGLEVDGAAIASSLSRLDYQCDENLQVSVPTWRVDVNDPVVLAEDIARLIGYDNIAMQPKPSFATLGGECAMEQFRQALAGHFSANGFYECRNPSLENAQLGDWLDADEVKPIEVTNPLTRDMTQLRRSLLSSLLRNAGLNLRRGADSIRFYEIDRVYSLGNGDANQPISNWRIAGIMGGEVEGRSWRDNHKTVDFFVLKGVLEDMLEAMGSYGIEFKPVHRKPYRIGETAAVWVNDKAIGVLGQVEPTIKQMDRSTLPIFGFELELAPLISKFTDSFAFRAPARTPSVTRDLAIVVAFDKAYKDIEQAIVGQSGPTLESVRLVDIYEGKQVALGCRSLAFRLVFRDSDRTLTAEEVNRQMEHLVGHLSRQFGAELR